MRNRLLTILGALTITIATFAPVALAQQAVNNIPRAADGRPDLSGTYNVATLTPLQRPEELGDKLTLTDEEAEALAKKEAAMVAKADEATNPDREAPAVGGSGFAGDIAVPELDFAAGEVGAYNWFWIDRGTGAIKIDGKWRTSIITDPENGRRPPLTPQAKKRADDRKLLRQENTGKAWWIEQGIDPGPYDNPEVRPLAERCLLGFSSTGGPPMLPALYNNMKQIVQTKDHVMILIEMVHDARIIRLNAEHDPPEIRKWLGDSVGHWEGDTLVVDTTNFTDQPALGGASRNLHVVERFARIDADTLRYQFTVDDPTVWTAPWSGEYIWPASTERVYEYACHEANYSFSGILRGARILEAEARAELEE